MNTIWDKYKPSVVQMMICAHLHVASVPRKSTRIVQHKMADVPL